MDEMVVVESPRGRFHYIEVFNAFDVSQRRLVDVDFEHGQTLRQILGDDIDLVEFAYTVNGRLLEPGEVDFYQPATDDYIVRVPMIRGSEDVKNVIRLAALVAIAFYAPHIAINMFGQSLAAAAFTVGLQIAGAMVVNALLPPAKPPGRDGTGQGDSSTYGVDGPKNMSAEGVPVPIVFGTHRFGGNIIGNYVSNDGDTQLLHLLINAGEGPIASISEVELDDQPITNYSAAAYNVKLGYNDESEPTRWFPSSVVPISIGQTVTTAFKFFTTTGEVDRVRLDFVAPSGLFYVQDDGNLTPVGVPIEVNYRRVGETVWQNFVDTNVVQAYAFEDEWFQFYSGFTSDSESPGWYRYQPTGGEVFVADSTGTGSGFWYANAADAVAPDADQRRVGFRKAEAIYPTGTFDISSASRNPVRRSLMSPPLPEGVYEIRYRRTTTPSTDGRVADVVALSDINQIINEPLLYRNTAVLEIQVKLNDQLNRVPTVTFMHGGKLIMVYDRATRLWSSKPSTNPAWITYNIIHDPYWGGGAESSRFDFEKWVEWAEFCDLNGLTFNGVFDTASNIWDAANAVARCGRAQVIMVGTRYSVVIERGDETPTMMFTTANIEKGSFKVNWLSLSERANEIEVSFPDKDDKYRQRTVRIYDQQALAAGEPTRTATLQIMGVVDAERAYAEADLLLKMNRYITRTVEWSSPMEAVACAAGDVVLVQHDMPQWGYGGRVENGCTQTLLQLDRSVPIEADASYKALLHYPALLRFTGSILSVTGDVILISGYNGNTSSWSPNRIKRPGRTTETQTLEVVQVGPNFGVRVEDSTGFSSGQTIELWQINAIIVADVINPVATGGPTVEVAAITLTAPLPQAPAQFTSFMFGKVSKVAKPFRVRQVTSSHEYTRKIVAIEYVPEVYIPGATPPGLDYSDLNSRRVNPPTDVVFKEKLVVSGGAIIPQVTVSYRSNQETYLNATVLVSTNSGPWEEKGRHVSHVSFMANEGDSLRVRFIAHDRFGNLSPSPLNSFVTYTVLGKTAPPGNVTGLVATIKPSQVQVSWAANAELDYDTTELRLGAVWESGTPLIAPGPTRSNSGVFNWPRPANGSYTIRARHRDTSGNYSQDDAVATITVDNSIDAVGTPGADAISAVLSPESLVLPADAAGNVSTYANATSTLRIFRGTSDDTGNWTITENGKTAGVTSSVTPGGVLTITAFPAGLDTGFIDLLATRSGFSNVSKRVQIAKARSGGAGAAAQTLDLTATSQTFTFDGQNNASPASQTITFNALLQNLTGNATFTCTLFSAAGANLGTVTLGGSGNTRTLTSAQFAAAAYAVVEATLSGITDRTTIVRLRDGAAGANGQNATVGLLTNETFAVAADPTGAPLAGALTGATGTFRVFNGTTDVTALSTFSVIAGGQVNCSGSINTSGVYSVTAITADSAELRLRAVYAGVTIDKTFSLVRTRNGTPGNNGQDSTSYWLSSSVAAIQRSAAGAFTPASVTFSAFSRTGINSPVAYAGRFVISVSTDGSSFSDAYTSAANESSTSFTVPPSARIVRARLFLAGGTSTLLFEQGLPVVADGSNGSNGNDGAAGTSTASVSLWQWSSTAPADPTNSTTYTWGTGAHTGTPGAGWSTTVPANPGTPGVQLWTVTRNVTAAAGTASTTVTWGAGQFTKQAVSANGANGSNGANGARFALLRVFQWASPPAPTIAGAATYTWASGAISLIPAGWSATPGISPSPGLNLYQAEIRLIDAATTATSAIDWSTAAVSIVGYAGTNGAAGLNAKLVALTATAQTFRIDQAGVNSPGSITLTASGQNLAGSPVFATSPSVTLTGTGNTRELSFASFGSNEAVTVTVTWDGVTDSLTIYRVREGTNAVTPILSNSAHTVPASNDGIVSSYLNSGTTIQVYEGGTLLQFSTTLSAGRFVIGAPTVSPASSITVGGITGSGTTTATVANHSGMSNAENVVAITYPVTVRRANGTDVTFNLVQTITKSRTGAQGATGPTGAQGASTRIAYARSTSSTLNTTPTNYQTTGSSSLPATNTWGGSEVWQAVPPTPVAGEWVFQVNGIYNPATDLITWGVPYVATFRVGSLSALSANLGTITAGSISIAGRASIPSDGYAVFRGIRIEDEAGNVVLQTRSGSSSALPSNWVTPAAGWLNSNITVNGSGQLTGIGTSGVQVDNNYATFSYAPNALWDFNGSALGWAFAGGNVVHGSTFTSFAATTGDPTMQVTGLSFSGAVYNRVRARIRRTSGSGWDGKVYYLSVANPAYSEARHRVVTPDPTVLNAWVVVEWDMSALTAGGSDWLNSTITGIRLDLGIGGGDSFDIDWIAIGRTGPAQLGELGFTGDTDAQRNNRITINAAGQIVGIGTAGVQVDNSYQTIGQNLLPDSDNAFRSNWTTVGRYNPNNAFIAVAPVRSQSFPSGWTVNDYILSAGRLSSVATQQEGRNALQGGAVVDGDNDGQGNRVAYDLWYGLESQSNLLVPVVPGTRYCYSVYLAAHFCNATIILVWQRADGSSISFPFSDDRLVVPQGDLTNTLGKFKRFHVIATAPADAVTARMVVRKYETFVGEPRSFLWIAAPQFEAVAPNATGPSPYQPGPPSDSRQLGYTGELDATRGAPSGTPVGSTTSDAVAAATAAVNDSNTGLAQRLRANAANILSGAGGLAAGTITWNGSGSVVSGRGVAITQQGIVARNASNQTTFTLDANTGNATFAGELVGASGTFIGSVAVGTGVTYSTGTGAFMGFDEGVPKFRIGAVDEYVRWTGVALEIKTKGAIPLPGSFSAQGNGTGGNQGIAYLQFRRNGEVFVRQGTSAAVITPVLVGPWHDPVGLTVGDGFQIRIRRTAGDPFFGPGPNDWVTLNSTVEVGLVAEAGGFYNILNSQASYEIRRVSDQRIVATGTIFLSASADPIGGGPA